jgi:tetratricopeptide (TPR) repeat protein
MIIRHVARPLAGALMGVGLLLASPLLADEVTLRNGEVIRGEIVAEDATTVTIKSPSKSIRISRARISEVRRSGPGEVEVIRARDALGRDRLEEARTLLKDAREKGVSAELADALEKEIVKRESEMELARYQALLQQARADASRGVASESLREVRAMLGKYDKESPIYGELREILVNYHQTLAREYVDKVRTDEAIQQLQRVLELDPNRAEIYVTLADIQRSRNSVAALPIALAAYRRALELSNGRLPAQTETRIYWEMAEIHRQQVNWRDASIMYRTVYQRDPRFNFQLTDRLMNALVNYARELESTQAEAALVVIDEALRIRPDANLHFQRGNILRTIGRLADSTKAFEESLKLNPRMRNARYLIGLNKQAEGSLLEAREQFEAEVAAFPDNYDALCELGEDALSRDDLAAAADFFSRARPLRRDLFRATLGLGRVRRLQDQLPEAKTLIQQILDTREDDREANVEMGRILLAEGKRDEASQFFTRVLTLIDEAPASEQEKLKTLKADALIARGEIALLTAGANTANRDFEAATQVLPNYGMAYFSIGNAYRRRFTSSKRFQDLEKSEENLLKARELSPENPKFALELGILYAEVMAKEKPENEKEYYERAKKHWRDYIELGGSNPSQVEAWIANLGG